MNKSSIGFLLVRGLGLGLLATFINGFSLPILLDLFSRVMIRLDTGTWYSGPFLVVELWLIFFTSGIIYSFFPSIIMCGILVLGIQNIWNEKMFRRWFRICAGMIIGSIAAVCYILLMFKFDPLYDNTIVNLQEHSLLAVCVFIEQVIIYGWLAARLPPHQQMQ